MSYNDMSEVAVSSSHVDCRAQRLEAIFALLLMAQFSRQDVHIRQKGQRKRLEVGVDLQ
jgi:hypothetical protein